jgi:ribonuclease HI
MPSKDEIAAAKTRAGWTRAQLAAWGVPWPPPRGWRGALIREHHEGVTREPLDVPSSARERTVSQQAKRRAPRVSAEPPIPVDATEVYTDGACAGNPGPGGWAWAVADGRQAVGSDPDTTNQRMEVTAALEAVRALDGDLVVRSDSRYLVNCFTANWWQGWLDRGWITTAKKPVANRDLWEPLIELVRDRGDVHFRWIKGHSGNPMNELVDRLAVDAAKAHDPAVERKMHVAQAKFDSRCKVCEKPIVRGVDILVRTVDLGWVHDVCSSRSIHPIGAGSL